MKYPVYIPSITEREKKNVIECIESTWISSKGKFVDDFEKKVEEYTGAKHAISVFNGTVALHLALEILGIGQGDDVIVPDFTYIASANAVKYTKANVVLADVCSSTWNIRVQDIKEVITPNTKAVIITDIYGNPPEMDEIIAFCKAKNIFVVADSAESIGATYKEKKTGSFADISTFSFFGNKTITTGEGGMITTNNSEWNRRLRKMKNQGNHETIRYYHDVLGYNYRMTNIQAAIGCAQMERIDSILDKKKNILNWYKKFLTNKVEFQKVYHHSTSSYWMVSFLLPKGIDRDNLMEKLAEKGIETRPFFLPIHKMPFYEKANHPVTENISRRGMNVPSYPDLNENDVEYICKAILELI